MQERLLSPSAVPLMPTTLPSTVCSPRRLTGRPAQRPSIRGRDAARSEPFTTEGAPSYGVHSEYEEALLDRRDGLAQWTEIARLVIKRRDNLIPRGIAERRCPGSTNVDDVEDPTPFLDPNKPAR